MQLILVLAVLMMLCDKSGGAPRPQLSNPELFEMLKYISGDNGEMDKFIKEAEQVTEIINAITPLVTSFGANDSNVSELDSGCIPPQPDIGICLKPIANIADDGIYNALSKAIN